MVFGYKVLRKIYGHNRYELRQELKMVRTKNLWNLHRLRNINSTEQRGRLGWTWHSQCPAVAHGLGFCVQFETKMRAERMSESQSLRRYGNFKILKLHG